MSTTATASRKPHVSVVHNAERMTTTCVSKSGRVRVILTDSGRGYSVHGVVVGTHDLAGITRDYPQTSEGLAAARAWANECWRSC